MFRILDWYIGRTILYTCLLCLLTLQGLSCIIKFVEQLNRVGQGDYQIIDALWFVLLGIPKELELFFPMAALLGSLIGLGSLAGSSELIVMQAAGLSRFKIAVSVIKTAVPMMVVMMLLSEYVAPQTELMAKELRASKLSGGSMIASHNGVWAKDGNRFVNIDVVKNGSELEHVSIYDFGESLQLEQVTYADKAYYENELWKMQGVEITQFADSQIYRQQLDEYFWVSSLSPDKLGIVSLTPFNLSMTELSSYINYLQQNKQDSSRYELAMWRKLVMPFTVGIMMLLALSFVFGALRSVSMGARLLMGIVLGFTFYLGNEILASLSLVNNLPPVLGAVGPSIGFLCLAMYLINRKT